MMCLLELLGSSSYQLNQIYSDTWLPASCRRLLLLLVGLWGEEERKWTPCGWLWLGLLLGPGDLIRKIPAHFHNGCFLVWYEEDCKWLLYECWTAAPMLLCLGVPNTEPNPLHNGCCLVWGKEKCKWTPWVVWAAAESGGAHRANRTFKYIICLCIYLLCLA